MDMSASNTSAADMGAATTMTMSMMSMTFFTSSDTPLYSTTWMPSGAGGYAGTCIFLVVLAVTFRSLLALKSVQEARWMDAEFNRRYINVAGKLPVAERMSNGSFDSEKRNVVLSENGVEENVVMVQKKGKLARPWRLTRDPIRAALDTVIVGVGYLLMLGVMTMNVGYFLSILAGTFVGSLAIGRFAISTEH